MSSVTFHPESSNPIVVEIGPHETGADLARRRPDIFRVSPDGGVAIGHPGTQGRPIHIVRHPNPRPEQLPLPVPDPTADAERVIAACVRRFMRAR